MLNIEQQEAAVTATEEQRLTMTFWVDTQTKMNVLLNYFNCSHTAEDSHLLMQVFEHTDRKVTSEK